MIVQNNTPDTLTVFSWCFMGRLDISKDTTIEPGDIADLQKLIIGDEPENSAIVIIPGKVVLRYSPNDEKNIQGVQSICIEKGKLVNLASKKVGISVRPCNIPQDVAINNLLQEYRETCHSRS